MPTEIISKKTRYEFREFLVGWVLREIEGAFDSADIECRTDFESPVGGARRSLVEQYYASLNFSDPRDVARLLRAYEYVLNDALEPKRDFATGNFLEPSDAARKLVNWLRKDGYDYVDGRIVRISGIARVTDVRAAAQELDAPHLADTIRRIEAAVDADPALAIGSAKELIETCCKTILSERGVTEDVDKLDLGPLVKRTAKELALVPESIPDSARGAESIRRVLSNLASVTQGLAEIRNLYGTGHGKDGKRRGLAPRHARLAVGAATTLVAFLLDTHRERNDAK
jgi:hypothetical protein